MQDLIMLSFNPGLPLGGDKTRNVPNLFFENPFINYNIFQKSCGIRGLIFRKFVIYKKEMIKDLNSWLRRINLDITAILAYEDFKSIINMYKRIYKSKIPK